MWGVLAGIVGARLYHVITSWSTVDDEWWEPFAVWEGGLGVWGGIGSRRARRRLGRARAPARASTLFMDAVAPGLLLAQAIGRWGNYFNQELFGEADRPARGALEIDPGEPAGRLRALPDLPPDVPLRVALVPARGRRPAARRAALQR